jgi:hypothetical protein
VTALAMIGETGRAHALGQKLLSFAGPLQLYARLALCWTETVLITSPNVAFPNGSAEAEACGRRKDPLP